MNRDLILTRDDAWDVLPHEPIANGRGDEPHSEMDLSRLLRVLYAWRYVILTAAAAGLLLGIAITLLTTPMYRATVILEVNPPSVQVINEQTQSSGPTLDAWQFVATQIGLLKSRGLAEHVAQELALANNPEFANQDVDQAQRLDQAVSTIAKSVSVAPQSDGQLVRFDIIWDDPEVAAKIANAYAEAFIGTSLQRRYDASTYARNFLQRQIASTRQELEKSERQLVHYAQAEGIIDTRSGDTQMATDASSPQGDSLLALNRALADATARRVAAEGAYRAALGSGVTSTETQSSQGLRQARAGLEAEYQQKRTAMKPEHPEMVSLRSQITELDRQIARENSSVASGRVNALRADYQAAAAAERALQGRVENMKSQVLDLRGRSIRYAILQRDVDTNRALYDALLQRYKEIGVAGGVGASPVSIVDQAEAPAAPFKPNTILNALVGLGLGLVAGVLAAIGLDILNDTIRTPADVRNKLRLACLGAIPRRSGAAKRMELLNELDDPTSPAAESYATLATSLRFATEEGVPRALLVTSPRAAEGKSSTALALSHHFAKLGKKVLLVDADLRKPSFRGRSGQKGLTTLLTTEEQLSENIIATKYENLWLLPCGLEPPNPAALLSSARFRSVIAESCAEFDLVVVDSPPLLGLADAPLIASVVSAVALVVESGRTRTSAAIEAIQRVSAAGANILGVTLTKTAAQHSGYGYGYGYGRYGYGKNRYGVAGRDQADLVSLTDETQEA